MVFTVKRDGRDMAQSASGIMTPQHVGQPRPGAHHPHPPSLSPPAPSLTPSLTSYYLYLLFSFTSSYFSFIIPVDVPHFKGLYEVNSPHSAVQLFFLSRKGEITRPY